MKNYVGLDVSLQNTAICILNFLCFLIRLQDKFAFET